MKLGTQDLPRSYWRRKAVEEKGMSAAQFNDRVRRWGDPKRAYEQPVVKRNRDYAQPESTLAKLRRAGLNRTALVNWRLRHPDSGLTDDQVIEVIQANKARFETQQAFRSECERRGLNPRTVRDWQQKYGLTEQQALERRPLALEDSGRRGKRARRKALQQETPA